MYTPIDFNEYINVEESEWMNHGDGSYDGYVPHPRRDYIILDYVCSMIYVLSDQIYRVFDMFPEEEYWECCEWDEVVPGMVEYFEVMFLKPEVFESRYKKQG